MGQNKVITRRDFLRGTAGAALAASLGSAIWERAEAGEKARVVLVRDAQVLDEKGKVDAGLIQRMLDDGVKTLMQESAPLRAWEKLFKRTDTVGIKTNVWARMPTPKELEDALKRRLLDLGIAGENIAIDDRGVLSNPVFLKATALINARPSRTHHWSGVGTCLKNYIQFAEQPSAYHPDGCSDLGKIWTFPLVKGKTRLNILSVLQPQFYGRGANYFDRRYLWPYKGLIIGTDPVAVDAIGAHLLQTKRKEFFGEERALDVPPVHITVADKKYHLGVSDLSRIELVRLGWKDEVLI